MVIYKTTNLVNGKIYIGQDKHNRKKYLGSGFILKKAIEKYGIENFKKEIIEKCNSKEELDEMEKYWIDYYKSTNNSIGYNIALGGQGGEILTYEQKIEMGVCDKISAKHKNVPLSDEHKQTISKGMDIHKSKKNIINKGIRSGEKNPFYGKTHTGDMSRFGKHRVGMPPTNALRVRRLDNNKEYSSCEQASKDFYNPNTARRGISDVCKGKRKDFMGITFEFVE